MLYVLMCILYTVYYSRLEKITEKCRSDQLVVKIMMSNYFSQTLPISMNCFTSKPFSRCHKNFGAKIDRRQKSAAEPHHDQIEQPNQLKKTQTTIG
jgi:hypothetical protein